MSVFDTMQPPGAGDPSDAEVAAMIAAGYAPDRERQGLPPEIQAMVAPEWFNDYHPLDVFRAGYALARAEAARFEDQTAQAMPVVDTPLPRSPILHPWSSR